MSRVRSVRRLVAGTGATSLLAIVAMGPLGAVRTATAASDWADFGTPTASSTFDSGPTFSQPVTVSQEVGRVELLLTAGGGIGPTIIEVPGPSGTGATTLRYTVDPSVDGHLLPNTPLSGRWRLIRADDSDEIELGPAVQITYADDRFDWRTEAGDLVRVHWYEGSTAFGERALAIGEDAVEQAADLLKVTESDPIDFFVYADQDAFYDALGPGTRENVGGAYIPGTRFMFALITPGQIDDSWVGSVVPHELTHLVFETAARNPYHFPPRWLNEGLAVYLSQGYDSSDRRAVEGAANAGTLISLDGLGGQFPTSVDRFGLAYAESVSAVEFLIRTYGRDSLVSLIRSYADGHTDDEAFEAAIGIDMTAFGEAWLQDLGTSAPTRYGPQAGLPGPVPAQWRGSIAGASPAPSTPAGAPRPGASNRPDGGTTTDATDPAGPVLIGMLVGVVLGVVLISLLVRHRAGSGSG